MFLKKLQENNPKLLEYAFQAEREGLIMPDTYLMDLDQIIANAKSMKKVADDNQVKLFFMLKQIGRNPIIAKALMDVGFDGCVAVDYREALVMGRNHIPLGNVGHLVQTPRACLKEIIGYHPKAMTVYSFEKILEIQEVAKSLNTVQGIMLRVTDSDSKLYSGQIAGFHSNQLEELLDKIATLDHVKVVGVTVFPALLFNDGKIAPTENMKAMDRALEIMKKRNVAVDYINVPSATCCNSIPLIHQLGGNNGEPGHGLTGTTPLHAISDQPEKVAYVYVSEVSHNYEDKAYCYGGGHYRRGHMENALVGNNLQDAVATKVVAPDMDSIDYHFELQGNFPVSQPVVMCFRTQIFTTRSTVAIVQGLSTGHPVILGKFSPLGACYERDL